MRLSAKPGASKGKTSFGFGEGLRSSCLVRVIALHEDAAGKVSAGGGAVDPADGVLDVACACLVRSRNSSMPWNWMPS